MDSNDIAYASVLIAKEAANSAFWTMIAAFISFLAAVVSAGVTVAAAVLAFKTMNTWRHQEEFKERKELKAALVYYRNHLVSMPLVMWQSSPQKEQSSSLLNDAANKIYLPLVVLEEDLNAGELGKRVNEFLLLHYDYLEARATRNEVAKNLSKLIAMKIMHLKS
ncbi:hypothetical protein [Pantoea piersonii]|uniref:hypothetical protein n=1 Tax=Pantoea piersonii TaxID=2364647 RepID=UPI002FD99C9E